jgi:2-dehydropantoate 2-reductase
MGQVPAAAKTSARTYGVVGDGRLARHLSHYFRLQGLSCVQWSRRQFAETGVTAAQALARADVILVMVSDAAIEPWIRQLTSSHPEFAERPFAHFSGALSTPLAVGLHPMMSFGAGFYEPKLYESIAFVGETGRPGFGEIFPTLPNPRFAIRPEERALYHSLCVMGGNFSVLLWQKLFGELESRFGIPAAAALPYLQQITRNLSQDSRAALTGPLARGDIETLEKNIRALEGDPFQAVYQGFVATRGPQEEKRQHT